MPIKKGKSTSPGEEAVTYEVMKELAAIEDEPLQYFIQRGRDSKSLEKNYHYAHTDCRSHFYTCFTDSRFK